MAKGFLLPALALVVSASRGVLSAPAAGMRTNVTTSDLDSPTPSEAESEQVAQAERFPSIADREERMPLNAQAAEEVPTLAELLSKLTLNNGRSAEKEPQLANSVANWLALKEESSNQAHAVNRERERESESAETIARLFSFLVKHNYKPEEIKNILRGKVKDNDRSGRLRATELVHDYKEFYESNAKR